jgi:hypothetical protein|nr:MAG TPA: hypothetical protein [Caudoviricetes sp.]
MSRVEELENEIKGLENRKIELLKELEVEKQKELGFPFEHGDKYFLLTDAGNVVDGLWQNYAFDHDALSQGNVFKTRKEAERERYKRELLMRFKQFRDKCNGDWKPTINEKKYYIFFNFEEQKFKIDWFCRIGIFELLGIFKNEADAERAIELFGDEIIRLYVEVD